MKGSTTFEKRALLAVGGLLFPIAMLTAAPPRGEEVEAPDIESAALIEGELVDMVISNRTPWTEPPVVPAAAPVPNPRLSVLVHFDPRSDAVRRPTVRAFAGGRGARVHHEYDTVLPNVINIRDLNPADLPALRAMPGVTEVEFDYEVEAYHNDSMPLIRAQQSQLQGAGFNVDGAGIRVCVADTGIDSNSIMYSGRIDAAAGFDFVNNDANPEDDNGHGSHVAGSALGGFVTADFACATIGPESMQGVAPAATLIGVKVLSASGSGSASNIIAGINRCASAATPGGRANVINLSLGGGQFAGTCDTDTMAQAVNNASNAGVTVVAAAGNNGFTNAVGTPACASSAIAVAAIYDENYPNCDFPTQTSFGFCLNQLCTSTCTDNNPVVNQRCCFSNRSTKIDVAAPGCIIFSNDSTVAAGNGLVGFCGTSQASPHVAGLAALLIDADPTLTPAEVKQIIRDGAVDLGAAGFDTSFGFGRIDAINSLTLATPPTGCTTHAQCDDGLFCNGAEQCIANTCTAGTAPDCSDAVACTTDSCNESTDSCDHTANSAACSDGLFCNGSETCNITLGCQAGSNPCAPLGCDEGTDSCIGGAEVWMSFAAATTVPVVGTAADEDIVARNVSSGAWSLIFDGSDVGLSGFVIDGIARLSDGSILLSFTASGSVTGMTGGPSGTTLDDSDIVRFVPTSLGATTAGSFVFYFDGSDVGLTNDNEDVDAIALSSSGQLVLSTVGNVSVSGVSGADADLLVFTPTSLGSVTAGSWAMHFDGSDVGMSASGNEDIDAATVTPSGTLLLSTLGALSVTGLSAADEDVVQFTPTSLGSTTAGSFAMYLDLSTLGIATSANVSSVEYKP